MFKNGKFYEGKKKAGKGIKSIVVWKVEMHIGFPESLTETVQWNEF